MAKDTEILAIELMFNGLNKVGLAKSFPPVTTLSTTLNNLVGNETGGPKLVDRVVLDRFASASVEMWHRALHSFFISASLTKASPLWASVTGYYSSHYVMRAFAHLFGYFHLNQKKLIIQLEISNGIYSCNILNKQGKDREHKAYWKLVKDIKYFVNDPFFYQNEENPPTKLNKEFKSDCGHRHRANYADHVGNFPIFKPLNEEEMKKRIYTISGIEINDVPQPNVSEYPDIDNVQLIAYQRILKYRSFLDNILPSKNRFWEFQRNPTWKPDYFDFQGVQPDFSTMLSGLKA